MPNVLALIKLQRGMGGLMGVTGNPEEGPMRAGTAVADLSSGLFASIGILVALQERAQSGQGQWVQSSLLESQISLMDFQAARYLIDGEVPQSSGNHTLTSRRWVWLQPRMGI
jgi:crotonobetainyl-CoA:carnitine CoA-transferase CaiB-like acyl-CoA transferase